MDFTDILNDTENNTSFVTQNMSNPDAIKYVAYSSVFMPTVFGIICLLGTAGNIVVIVTVFKKSKFRCRSSVPDIFIVNLSVVDLLFLLGMPLLIHQLLGNGVWRFGESLCTIITALDSNSQFTSTYILTAMTLDRYLATVYPLASARFRTPAVAVRVICLVWLLSFLSITPVWMYARLIPLPGGVLGCGIRLPRPETDIYWYTLYQFFLAFAVPFAIISVAYRRILLRMSSSEALTTQRSARRKTKRVTRIAITICLVFFCCWAPFYVLQLVQLALEQPTLSFYYAYRFVISLGYANSCLNPFIYIVLCESFRRRLIVSVRPVEEEPRSPARGRRQHSSDNHPQLLHLVPVTGR